MADSYNKKDREKKRRKRKQEKAEKMQQRKEEGSKEVEYVYVDEFGNLTSTPPDPSRRRVIRAEDIEVSTPKREAEDPMEIIRFGIVKFFNDEKGYGFITDRDTQDSLFVHIENVTGEIGTNDKVTFEIANGPKGPVAVEVKVIND
ncbi:MAG: cold shock domain-containing protein [Chitinophagales bacterium]